MTDETRSWNELAEENARLRRTIEKFEKWLIDEIKRLESVERVYEDDTAFTSGQEGQTEHILSVYRANKSWHMDKNQPTPPTPGRGRT